MNYRFAAHYMLLNRMTPILKPYKSIFSAFSLSSKVCCFCITSKMKTFVPAPIGSGSEPDMIIYLLVCFKHIHIDANCNKLQNLETSTKPLQFNWNMSAGLTDGNITTTGLTVTCSIVAHWLCLFSFSSCQTCQRRGSHETKNVHTQLNDDTHTQKGGKHKKAHYHI